MGSTNEIIFKDATVMVKCISFVPALTSGN